MRFSFTCTSVETLPFFSSPSRVSQEAKEHTRLPWEFLIMDAKTLPQNSWQLCAESANSPGPGPVQGCSLPMKPCGAVLTLRLKEGYKGSGEAEMRRKV